MSTIQIFGSSSLKGEIEIQGSKNAVLPIMAAALLYEGVSIIKNVPRIQDVFCMIQILEALGCAVTFVGNEMTIDASVINSVEMPEEHVVRMRSSIMVLGALLGRANEAVTYLPGGCSIGERPIDLHIMVLNKLGAQIVITDCCIDAKTEKLIGRSIDFPKPSVGATENAILAAVKAEGTTILRGYAKEPEILELCNFLKKMGADISGMGTDSLRIQGGKELHQAVYTVGGDRIVAGTYLAAGMASKGEVLVTGVNPSYLTAVMEQFRRMGARVKEYENEILLKMEGRPAANERLITRPYPEFPTDMQSQAMVILSLANGYSTIEEEIFEARMETAGELVKMGADIKIDGNIAKICGVRQLEGASVEAKDLRGGAALVIAGICAGGTTTILNCCHILRGYEDICKDMNQLGGNLKYRDGDS